MRTQSVSWSRNDRVSELLNEAVASQTDYLILEPHPSSVTASISFPAGAELIAVRDAGQTERWSRLGSVLPSAVYFLAVPPSAHLAIAISVKTLVACARSVSDVRSWNELFVRIGETIETSFVDKIATDAPAEYSVPGLTFADGRPGEAWERKRIEQVTLPGHATSIEQTAFKAGLYLLNDFFEESHSESQSIEGMGSQHTGDYWHAILHRREPDSGNAKYWFRHVGRHPSFVALALSVNRRLSEAQGLLATKLQPWKSRLTPQGAWDPFAFIDLCTTAERDRELRSWCEQVQYDEMLLLLEQTIRGTQTV